MEELLKWVEKVHNETEEYYDNVNHSPEDLDYLEGKLSAYEDVIFKIEGLNGKRKMVNKVVINNCYGGFGLSNEAFDWLIEHGLGKGYYQENPNYIPNSKGYLSNQKYYLSYTPEIPRHHPLLVQCVEELGNKANGPFSDLIVVEISGNEYLIDEYDGLESIKTPEMKVDWIKIN